MFTAHAFRAKAYNEKGERTGPGRWLNLVWAANGVESGFFGKPELRGDGVELYPHAKVIFELKDDGDVTVIATTKIRS